MTDKTQSILLAVILVLGLAIRLAGVHWGLPSKSGTLASYQPDEPNVFIGLGNMRENRSLNAGREGLLSGTLYFYLSGALLLAAKVAGYVMFGSRELLAGNLHLADRMYIVVRLFSVFAVLLAIWATFRLTHIHYWKSAGLISAFALAFSPM